MSAAPPPPQQLDARSAVLKLRQHTLVAFAVLLCALAGAQLLRAVAPAPGSFDDASQMAWVQPHLDAMRAAWLAAGGADAPSGAQRVRVHLGRTH